MKINFCEFENYREQMVAEQMRWHKANNPGGLSEDQIAAFHAGFNDGWRQLLSALVTHAGLKTSG